MTTQVNGAANGAVVGTIGNNAVALETPEAVQAAEATQAQVLPFAANGEGSAQEAGEQEAQTPVVLVSLKLRDGAIAQLIADANHAHVTQTEGYFIVSAPHIKVARNEVEVLTGKLRDLSWKMLFVNREGEVREFSNTEFFMGALPEAVEEQPEEAIEMTQFNVKIPKTLKDQMDKLRGLLGEPNKPMTQNEYVVEALRMMNEQIGREII